MIAPSNTISAENTTRRDNGRRRPRGYADWSPRAKTRVLLEQVHQVLEEYRDHLPLSVRQIFYRLVAGHGYEKTERAYGRLSEVLVRARRARLIPFRVIRDDGVLTASSEWYGDQDEFWDDTARRIRRYSRDRQAGQAHYMELWCEAGGMVEQLAKVADVYSVPVFSGGGYLSLTAVQHIATRALDRLRPTVILHVGDFDPSGESIFTSLTEDAAAFVAADRTIQTLELCPVRVALTAQQVAYHHLPTAPPKSTDSRSGRWAGETCQLEALPPDLLADTVAAAIHSHLDFECFEREVAAEDRDRLELYEGLPAAGETA